MISAAKSSRCSAASFARRRAARARARGVVKSCWTGSDLHVSVGMCIGFGVNVDVDGDVKLIGIVVIVVGPDAETCVGFGVARSEAAHADEDADGDGSGEAEIRVDIGSVVEGAKDANATSDDIFFVRCSSIAMPDKRKGKAGDEITMTTTTTITIAMILWLG